MEKLEKQKAKTSVLMYYASIHTYIYVFIYMYKIIRLMGAVC